MYRELLGCEVESVSGGDIVVTAQRPFLDYQPDITDPYHTLTGYGTSDPWNQYYLAYYGAMSVTFANMGAPADVIWTGDNSLATTNANTFRVEMSDIDAGLDSHLPFKLDLAGIGSITLAEIQNIFHKMDFTITDGVQYPPGYGGETGMNADGTYYSHMAKETLSFYAAFGDRGLDFIALHEVAHNSTAIKAYETTLFNAYYTSHGNSSVGWSTSTGFALVEQAADAAARAIAIQLGLPLMPNPQYGY